jgi:tRNA pseudouridine38-40 synthase
LRTIKLTIAYDGTDFAGWQRQATERTVQAAIEDALGEFERTGRVVIVGAGRTDAGVHAAGQVASAMLHSPIACADLQRGLNAKLPEDVRIIAVDEMPSGFNAQFAARRKTYRYWIWSSGVVPPQRRRYVWHVPQWLDLDLMHQAAQSLVGEHDFAGFQAAGGDVVTTVRLMVAAGVRRIHRSHETAAISPIAPGELVLFEITGTGFLRHMVRNIAGTLVDIGRKRRGVEDIAAIIAARDRSLASATAPPHGLTLWRVEY